MLNWINQLLKAPFVKTFNVIKNQTGSYDFEGLEVRRIDKTSSTKLLIKIIQITQKMIF